MEGQQSQLSRYGAIAKHYPLTTGAIFFLVNPNETAAANFLKDYPVGPGGTVHVYTTWAAVIAATQSSTDADVIVVSPLFITPPTQAQIAQLDAAQVVTLQAGQNLPDGSYIASKVAAALPQTTTLNLFQVNGRIRVLDIIGEVTTTIQTQTDATKLSIVPTVGTTVDLCATSNISAVPVGGQLSITGTLSAALVVTTTGGAFVEQAVPLIVAAGNIILNCAASNTGNVKWKIIYQPIDHGAFVSPL